MQLLLAIDFNAPTALGVPLGVLILIYLVMRTLQQNQGGGGSIRRGPTVPGVRCPHCQWNPAAPDYWTCDCGRSWNTFDTHGKCPGCHKVHSTTQCLSCGNFSPHNHWYR
jgi:hypothetical protein